MLAHHKATLQQVVSSMNILPMKLDLRDVPEEVYLIAIGKGSKAMLEAFNKSFTGKILDGVVLNEAPIQSSLEFKNCDHLSFFTGTHPLPSEANEASTLEIISFIKQLPPNSTLVCLLSGGSSALLCLPPESISLSEMQATYQLLLHSGASIEEMNTVRKHLSLIKGGQLAQYAHQVRLQTFLLSDVPKNTAHVIGSGPTLTDPTTFQDAIDVLHAYQLVEKVPSSVQDYLRHGALGFHPDTPKPGLNDHPEQHVHLITGAKSIGPFLESLISQQGFSVHWSNTPIQALIKKEAQRIAAEVISVLNGQSEISSKTPQALVYHGESYAQVTSHGKGGRNQELALLLALSLEGQHPVSILTLATDGIDGPTDAAGALVTSYTTLDARKQECSPESYIHDNNSYHFHEQMNTLVKTGPTGNNLMDLCVVLIG